VAGIQNVRFSRPAACRSDDPHVMSLGVSDPIVRKVTGHRSRELERYQHLTPELRALTVNLIATELFRGKRARKERESGTPTGTVRGTEDLEGRAGTKGDVGLPAVAGNSKSPPSRLRYGGQPSRELTAKVGGVDGTRAGWPRRRREPPA
jgi:hypothetical protein